MRRKITEDDAVAGFSLVETLVGLSILSLLSIVLLGAFQQIYPLYRAGKNAGESVELGVIADFLEGTIEGALPVAEIHSADRRVAFEGSSHRLRFVGNLRVGSDEVGFREIVISFEPADGGKLMLETASRRTEKGEITQELIVEGIYNLRFEFLANVSSDGPVWKDMWSDADRIPAAVRVTIRKQDGRPSIGIRRTIFLRNAVHSLRKSAS
ncbi:MULTISPECIES: hypothetical protein [unclassified Ensifer]|uniref:hypothetical protein n=1 Tax=unclassified Ensifer TaxID=2633371 RepID=UPI000A42D5B8|nr:MULTISPECIES: hypothetical protein [unclassified Ensifer]